MKIHFVCSGNFYRSRLAEAYFKSISKNEEIEASSSGIVAEAKKMENGPIDWFAMRLMKRYGLVPFMSWKECQTSKEVLKDVDLLICMRQFHLDFCQNLGYKGRFEVWDVPDLEEVDSFIPSTVPGIGTDINHIQISEQTYEIITEKVDELVRRLSL